MQLMSGAQSSIKRRYRPLPLPRLHNVVSNDDTVVHFLFFRFVLGGDFGESFHDIIESASRPSIKAGAQRSGVILQDGNKNCVNRLFHRHKIAVSECTEEIRSITLLPHVFRQ